jgi:uncharacterized membrane protein YraQ (UPF0718 family)
MENLIIGIIIFTLTAFFYIYYLRKDKNKLKNSISKGSKNLAKNSIRIFAIFMILGILQNFLSKEAVGKFLLKFSGFKGIIAGALTGSVMMGPVVTGYPISNYLLQNGATYSLITAFLVSWVMIGIISITFEIKYLGKKFAITRNIFAFLSAIGIAYLIGVIL